MIISVAFTLIHIYMSDSKLLPTALCNAFCNPNGEIINQLSALLLAALQIVTCLAVVIMYCCLLKNSKQSLMMECIGPKNIFHKRMMIQIFLITNIICWVPSAAIYILSVFMSYFPTKVLLYTTIYITPLNSLINPIFIIIVNKE